jgi:tRNA(His) guanylyltransferase
MGAQFAFVQSDEISVLLTDFATPQTEAWFDGNLQKICSVSASIATAHFNKAWLVRNVALGLGKTAYFDSRVWAIPQPGEVYNYFLWRQQDASRNSVSMTARAYFSHAVCKNKSGSVLQEMLFTEKGVNWNDLPIGFKRGRVILKVPEMNEVRFVDKRLGGEQITTVERGVWKSVEPPLFSAIDTGGREATRKDPHVLLKRSFVFGKPTPSGLAEDPRKADTNNKDYERGDGHHTQGAGECDGRR